MTTPNTTSDDVKEVSIVDYFYSLLSKELKHVNYEKNLTNYVPKNLTIEHTQETVKNWEKN